MARASNPQLQRTRFTSNSSQARVTPGKEPRHEQWMLISCASIAEGVAGEVGDLSVEVEITNEYALLMPVSNRRAMLSP